jgi:Tol biopolymer transport system component
MTRALLFVVAPDGSAVHRISASAESLVQPSWSADGAKILAARYTLDEEAASIVVREAPETRMQ